MTNEFQQKTDKLCNEIEKLELRAETLTEKLTESNKENREFRQKLQDTEKISREALRLSNRNEQYSRKFNFKITGMKEQRQENTEQLVKEFIAEKTGVQLDKQWRYIASLVHLANQDLSW